MGGYEDRKPFPTPRSPPMHGGGSRQFGLSGGFDRFSRERRGRSSRAAYSGSGYKSSFDRRSDLRKRPSDLRGRLAYKRSWSDNPSKDDHSKFKRHRGSSQDGSDNAERMEKTNREEERSSAGRNESHTANHNEEKDGMSKSDGEDGQEKKKDEFPTEALYCHMCKHGNFTSEKTYLFHLEGVRHRKTAVAFHAKNEATLEYLRKNAKLASIRFGGMDNSVTPSRCSICTALVKESFYKHKKLLEHRVVKKFLKPKCCNRYFKTRYDMDEHRLSLPHLRKIYKANEEKQLLMEDCMKGEGAKWSCEDAIKHLKSKNPIEDEELSLENIPPFDGNSFIGVNFLESRGSMLCKPCQMLLPIGVKSLESHLTSMDHYNTVVDYLREKKRKPVESATPEKVKKEEKPKESEEESDEEDDDDAVAEEIRNSDDEGDKGLPFIDEDAHIVLEEIDDEDTATKEED